MAKPIVSWREWRRNAAEVALNARKDVPQTLLARVTYVGPWDPEVDGREVAPAAYRIGTRRGPTKGGPASISVTKRYLEPLTLGGLIKEVWLDVPTGQTKVCVVVRYQ
jgi:hypothetical protein